MVKKIKRMKPWKRKANVYSSYDFKQSKKKTNTLQLCSEPRTFWFCLIFQLVVKLFVLKQHQIQKKNNPLISTWKYVYCIANIQVEGETDLPGYRCLEGTEVLKTYQENSYRRKLFRKKGNFNIELSPEVTKRQ